MSRRKYPHFRGLTHNLDYWQGSTLTVMYQTFKGGTAGSICIHGFYICAHTHKYYDHLNINNWEECHDVF